MKRSLQSGIMQMYGTSLYVMSAKIIGMCTIIAYVISGHELTSQKVFKLLAWLEVARFSLFYGMNRSVMYLSQAYFSSQRIEVSSTCTPFTIVLVSFPPILEILIRNNWKINWPLAPRIVCCTALVTLYYSAT